MALKLKGKPAKKQPTISRETQLIRDLTAFLGERCRIYHGCCENGSWQEIQVYRGQKNSLISLLLAWFTEPEHWHEIATFGNEIRIRDQAYSDKLIEFFGDRVVI